MNHYESEKPRQKRSIFGDLYQYKWTVINCVLVYISVINWFKVMLDGRFFFGLNYECWEKCIFPLI